MLEALTGLSLAAAAGLNAYIPLLGLALLSRFTGLIELPGGWAWLENGWVIAIFAALLVIEVIVDKVPALDSANDVLQTLVRPASGGLVFSAGATSSTAAVTDPAAFASSPAFWPFVLGAVFALLPHLAKLLVRPAVNLATAGLGATMMSTLEDLGAAAVTVLAVLAPLLALALILLLVAAGIRWLRRARARRAAAAAGLPAA